MLDSIKEKAISKGMNLLQSPAVAKLMESEKMGVFLEKAMSIPIKVSDGMRGHRDRVTSLFELATRDDLDDVKRTVARMEDLLRDIKDKSADLLNKTNEEDPNSESIAK